MVTGKIIEVRVSPRRDAEAARRFLRRALATVKIKPIEVVCRRKRQWVFGACGVEDPLALLPAGWLGVGWATRDRAGRRQCSGCQADRQFVAVQGYRSGVGAEDTVGQDDAAAECKARGGGGRETIGRGGLQGH